MVLDFIKKRFHKKNDELPPLDEGGYNTNFEDVQTTNDLMPGINTRSRLHEGPIIPRSEFGNPSDRDTQLILTKLDLIIQRLEVLDRRLQIIEKIAKDSE